MNYHSDTWINNKVKEHYVAATQLIPDNYIISVTCQGSQNYGLDYEASDIDTRCIFVPSIENLILNNISSKTHILPNNEHIDFHSVKHIVDIFLKQNINFLEILFSKYYISNSVYWNILRSHAEEIATYDRNKFIKTCWGAASNKYHKLYVGTQFEQDIVNKLGYSPKNFCHLLRIEEVMRRYIAGESFADCLQTKQREFLMALKLGMFKVDSVEKLANDSFNHITAMANNMLPDEKKKNIKDMLYDVTIEIYKNAYKERREKND